VAVRRRRPRPLTVVREFVQLGGPAFVVAFALGLFIRLRFLVVVGVLTYGCLVGWALLDDPEPLEPAEDFRVPVFTLWLVVWLVGLGLAGLIRGTGWLFGIGADDR
jgi:hypothetical protein